MWLLALLPSLLNPTPETRVVVAGATGRVGRLVVQKILQQEGHVHALVRDTAKAAAELPASDRLMLSECDFAQASSADAVRKACESATSVVWCATGFSEEGRLIDLDAIATITQALKQGSAAQPDGPALPRVVMLSSAGVTRTSWEDEKKARLIGAADIPSELKPARVAAAVYMRCFGHEFVAMSLAQCWHCNL
jgi:uncharacterized protein YbjT (DUF2867 family)